VNTKNTFIIAPSFHHHFSHINFVLRIRDLLSIFYFKKKEAKAKENDGQMPQ
jgi:hypothetical protein